MTQDKYDEYAAAWDGRTGYSLKKVNGIRTWVPDKELTEHLLILNYGGKHSY